MFHLYAKQRRKLKTELYIAQGSKCYYCQKPIFIEDFTLDHIRARSKKGGSTRINYVGACRKCNTAKDNKSVTEFMEGK